MPTNAAERRCAAAVYPVPARPPTSSYNMTSRALDRATDSALVLTGCDLAGSVGRRSTRDAEAAGTTTLTTKRVWWTWDADFSTLHKAATSNRRRSRSITSSNHNLYSTWPWTTLNPNLHCSLVLLPAVEFSFADALLMLLPIFIRNFYHSCDTTN